MKRCGKCGDEFPKTIEYFEVRNGSKDGFRGQCKKCRTDQKVQYYIDNKEAACKRAKEWRENNQEYYTEWHKQHYQENKERISARNKQYRDDNKELVSAQKLEYRRTHKAHISAHDKIYREANREKLVAYSRLYYQCNKASLLRKGRLYYEKNKERHRETGRKYYLANREKITIYHRQYNIDNKWRIDKDALRARGRQWGRDHKDAINVKSQRRRTMRKQLPHTLTFLQWEQIKSDFNQSCAYCGQVKKLTIEHFIPLSKGGELTINNVLPICSFCNGSRSNHDFSTWYKKQPFYTPEREARILSYLGYVNGIQQLSLV